MNKQTSLPSWSYILRHTKRTLSCCVFFQFPTVHFINLSVEMRRRLGWANIPTRNRYFQINHHSIKQCLPPQLLSGAVQAWHTYRWDASLCILFPFREISYCVYVFIFICPFRCLDGVHFHNHCSHVHEGEIRYR